MRASSVHIGREKDYVMGGKFQLFVERMVGHSLRTLSGSVYV